MAYARSTESAVTEAVTPFSTSQFSFSVPRRRLSCTVRHSVDRRLGLVTSGVVLIRGEIGNIAFADFVDLRTSVSIAEPEAGLDEVTFPTGVRMTAVEPASRIDLSYASADGRLLFECSLDALVPPTAMPDGDHFAQAMSTFGELVLDGERLAIDGYSVREHNFTPHGDEALGAAPVGCGGVVFGPDLAFHFAARDGEFLDEEKLVRGCVWRNGEIRPLEAAWMRTGRAADGAAPTGVEVRLRDADGETYEIAGETHARAPLNLRPDMIDQLCLMRYRLKGRTCHGQFQDFQSNEFLRAARA